jgi:DNA-binding LacI/PurR family transcriptional regulator
MYGLDVNMLKVLSGNKVSLHQQVATQLEQRVRKGVYKDGDALPSFRSLSKEFGVSLNVVQRAVYQLEEKRVLVPHHGRGLAVANSERCNRTAITFGFIQPYSAREAFEQQVILYAEEAFTTRDNLMIIRSCQGSAEREREVAQNLVHNGIQGILLWPAENNPNGPFFQEFSSHTPVVLVDRLLEGAELPAVVLDVYKAGREICQQMLSVRKHRRMLALIDDLDVSPYRDVIRGLQDQAKAIGRSEDLVIERLGITPLIKQWYTADFSQVETNRKLVEERLKKGGYDALFCFQEEFFDFVIVETGLLDDFSGLQLVSLNDPSLNTRTRKYNESGVLTWGMDFPRMISIAADLLQQWVLTRTRTKRMVKVDLSFNQK